MNMQDTHEPLETRLARALQVNPSADSLSWLDRRIGEVMAEKTAAQRRPRRLLLRVAVLLAAFVLLTGAVAAALGLLERTATQGGAGFRAAWENGEVIEITQTDAGHEVTLERIYADVNQVIAFLSVRGPAMVSPDGAAVGTVFLTAGLTDPTGRALEQPYATGAVEPDLAVVVTAWGPPSAEAGSYVLTVSAIEPTGGLADEAPQAIAGEWRFEFELPEPAGTIVATDASDTDQGVTVSLTELRISPTMIAGRMYLEMEDGSAAPYGVPIISAVRHDGEKLNPNPQANMIGLPVHEEGATGFDFHTGFGSETASGSWEVEISEIDFVDLVDLPAEGGALNHEILSGTWTLMVIVP